MPGPRWSTLCLLASWLLSAAAVAADHRVGDIVIEPARTIDANGRAISFELGTLYVPENRSAAGSRVIGVGFARIRGRPAAGTPPIFMLPGGPGNSYLNAVTGNDAAARLQLAGVLPYTAAGDVVLVDQRGFSRRGEILELPPGTRALGKPRTAALEAAAMTALAQAAVAANPGRDLSGYTVVECAEDVNDLRRALGYERITLSGQSFGSQWSFAVMRLHPETVARALLSGTEPLGKNFDMPSQVFAALQRIAWDADHDPGLAPYRPAGGIMTALAVVQRRFAEGPVSVRLGDRRTIVLGLEDLQASLVRPAADWPAFVLELYHRRYEDWAREVAAVRDGEGGRVRLIQPLIDSALAASAERQHHLRSDAALSYIGVGDFDPLLASADAWPTADAGDDLRRPERTEIPVVFIHGDWDTSTPLENMLGSLPYFPNSRALVVHRAGHQSRASLFAASPVVLDGVIAFLRTGVLPDLPVEVTLPVPTFRVPAFPAPKP